MKIKKLKYWLSNKEQLFADFDSYVLDKFDKNKHRIFIDRGSSILFVAHIDTVHPPKFVKSRKTKSGNIKRVYAHGLDDRLGCMIAHQLSEELNVDLLICDLEEKCRSTGHFHELKDYNWIAEFDRENKDVVTYDLDCDTFRHALTDYWKVGFGTYSDILKLQTTACCMNLGIGHHFSHSKDSYVCVKTMNRQIVKFREFYKKYKDTPFVRDYRPQSFYNDYIYDDYNEDHGYIQRDYQGVCEICGLYNKTAYVFDHILCQDCLEEMITYYCYNEELKHYEDRV